MEKYRKIIFVGIVLLALFWMWEIAARKRETRFLPPNPAATGGISEKVRTSYADWGRNPFMLSGELSESVRGLMLDGIVWDEEKPYAIINNQVLGIGSQIGRSRITQITKEAVFLEEDGNPFSIRLKNAKDVPAP